tara:strand:+ start:17 stop:517 length:501 start_codon:yes stop_codon:yes gene_type:complete
MKEEFKDIPNYEGIYQVSDLGRVKSLTRKGFDGRSVKERILKPAANNNGYLLIALRRNGKTNMRTIHQLVAEAFLGHTPCGHKLIVNHINFNRQDNRAENLEIDTQRNNTNQKHIKSSSKYTGVCWAKDAGKWMSAIRINGNRKHLGYFTDELEASQAYQDKLKTL